MDIRALEYVDRFQRYLVTERRSSPHTASAYRHSLAVLVRLCDKARIEHWSELEVAHVRTLSARQHARGLSPASVQHWISAVRSFLNFLIREGVIAGNPAVLVQGPKIRRRLPAVLDVDQMARLLDIRDADPLATRDKAIMELLYSSALRVAELIGLDCGDLDQRDRTVRVVGKGDKTRIVPVGRFAVAAIRRWLTVRPAMAKTRERALFVGRRGDRLSSRDIQIRVAYWAKRQGITIHVYPHIFRHSCATHLLESSRDIRYVQETLGHASISTTQIYTHLDAQHLTEVYRAAHPRAHLKGASWTPTPTPPVSASRPRRSRSAAESRSRPPPVGNAEPPEPQPPQP